MEKDTFDYKTFIRMCKKYMITTHRLIDFKKHKNRYCINDEVGNKYDISKNYSILKEKVERGELSLTQKVIADALFIGIDLNLGSSVVSKE